MAHQRSSRASDHEYLRGWNLIENLLHLEAESLAWQFLLAARELLSQSDDNGRFLYHDSATGQICRTDKPEPSTWLWLDDKGHWQCKSELPLICKAAFDLYLPVLGNRVDNDCVTAHLGQSIDARIATSNGDSFYVTGEENRKHLHCLRALSDAVIVGAGTVIADNPQLTTRAVPGMNPVRIILDSRARLDSTTAAPLQLFSDGKARTILVHQSSTNLENHAMQFGPPITDHTGATYGQVERWVVPDSDTVLSADRLVEFLRSKGLRRLFVEGGGITVSRFFEERVLDRLHVAVAPLLVGEGRQSLQLAGAEKMIAAHRPPHAIYRMGEDILWDFDVSAMKNTRIKTGADTMSLGNKPAHEQVKRPLLERLL